MSIPEVQIIPSLSRKLTLRSSPTEGRFSPTSLQDFSCPRKYYFKHCRKLIPRGDNAALTFGSAIHEAVGTFYACSSLKLGEILSRFQVTLSQAELSTGVSKYSVSKSLTLNAFEKTWKEANIPGDDKRNLQNGVRLMDLYCENYKQDTASFVPEYIESPVYLEMPDGTLLIMVVDRIRKEGNHITIVDTKTSSMSLTDYYFANYQNDFQTTAYYYAVNQILGQCNAIQIDGIYIGIPKTKDGQFSRRSFLRTDLQLNDWLNTYLSKVKYIMDSLKETEAKQLEKFYCEQGECSKFGGCPYLPVCIHGLKHPAVKVEFEEKGE